MKRAFNDLPWHDADLLAVDVDRRDPGVNDAVDLLVRWADGSRQRIRFVDCYQADLSLHFGVASPETIREGVCIADDGVIQAIRSKWDKLGVSLPELRAYRVTTNSTNSAIGVYALGFEVFDDDGTLATSSTSS